MIPSGYKQTEIGVIPEDWDLKKIGDFTSSIAGGTPSTQISSYWNGGIKWMNSGELNKRRIYDVVGRITKLGLENSSTHLIPTDCVLIGLAGQGKTRGTVAINYVELCTNQSIAAIFPSTFHSTDYLYHNLSYRYQELREISSGDGGRGGLNLKIINNLIVPMPPLVEQKRIAEALSDMDKLIFSLEKLIAKKKAIKQGAMQELLTGKRRLPGFSGKWVTLKVESIVSRFATGLNPRQNFILNSGGMNYYVTIKNFRNGVLCLDDNCDRIDDAALQKINERSDLKKNDLLFSSIGRIGDAYLIRETPTNWNINESVFALRPNVKIISPLMLFWLLSSESVKQKLIESTTGSTLKSIKLGHLKEIECTFPSDITEQETIASILFDMDDEIEQLEKNLSKYKKIKSGMMSELLTGRIRLI